MAQNDKILVVALGNGLAADDGVGTQVLQELAGCPLPEEVRLMDAGCDGLSVLYELENVSLVFLIDAVDCGKNAGEWFVASPKDLKERPGSNSRFSLHQPSAFDIIELSKVFNNDVDFKIVGIQPGKLSIHEGLSESVQEAVPCIASAIRKILSEAVAGRTMHTV